MTACYCEFGFLSFTSTLSGEYLENLPDDSFCGRTAIHDRTHRCLMTLFVEEQCNTTASEHCGQLGVADMALAAKFPWNCFVQLLRTARYEAKAVSGLTTQSSLHSSQRTEEQQSDCIMRICVFAYPPRDTPLCASDHVLMIAINITTGNPALLEERRTSYDEILRCCVADGKSSLSANPTLYL